MEVDSTKLWASRQFGIAVEDIAWYHSGTCYDRIGVKNRVAADAVAKTVKGEHVNGGMLHGMELGGITVDPSTGIYGVVC